MIVVADTSPLNYLVLIDEVELLPALFGEVLIPQAVFQELKHPKTPAKVQQWISHFPAWLQVRTIASVPSPALMKLDVGEREAIQLALELGTVPYFSMKLRNLIKDLYRVTATIGDGGTADAITYTKETGELVGGSDHIMKGVQYARALERVINSGRLDAIDQGIAQQLLNGLRNALQ